MIYASLPLVHAFYGSACILFPSSPAACVAELQHAPSAPPPHAPRNPRPTQELLTLLKSLKKRAATHAPHLSHRSLYSSPCARVTAVPTNNLHSLRPSMIGQLLPGAAVAWSPPPVAAWSPPSVSVSDELSTPPSTPPYPPCVDTVVGDVLQYVCINSQQNTYILLHAWLCCALARNIKPPRGTKAIAQFLELARL